MLNKTRVALLVILAVVVLVAIAGCFSPTEPRSCAVTKYPVVWSNGRLDSVTWTVCK